MNNDISVVYSAIGDTSKKIYEASDALIGVVEKIRKADAIAAFMVPGPKWSKCPWMVMVGPAPEMCENATTMARECFSNLIKHYKSEIQQPDEGESE